MRSNVKEAIQLCCFPLTLLTNCSLIYLICTKSPTKLGTYKYLMIFFAVVSVSYSFFEALLSPLLLSYGDCFQVIATIQFVDYPSIDRYLLYYGCGFCGVITSMFVVHFIYRFFALERRGNLKYFERWYFPCWLSVPLTVGLVWAQALFHFLYENEDSDEYIKNVMLEDYNKSLSEIVYVGVLYHKKAENGEDALNWTGIQGVSILGGIMTICFILIIYFGTRTYRKIKLLVLEGRSEFTRRLQKQLYHALVIQTIIPVFFLILPLSVFFFSPLFHLGAQIIGDVTTLTIAFYPIIDPLPVIFVIDNYRNAVFELVGMRSKPKENTSGTNQTNNISGSSS